MSLKASERRDATEPARPVNKTNRGNEMLKVAHIFAGIEGFRKGLDDANTRFNLRESECKGIRKVGADFAVTESRGFVSVYANDFDKYACAISRYNYPDGTTHEGDIRAINTDELPDFDLLTFGWPCQDNSIAGKRRGMRTEQGENTRSGLLNEAIRILRAKMPRYFFAENVPGLFSVTNGEDFYEAIRLFTDSGYDIQWQVLNTRWFLPQNRERIIFVGHIRGTSRPQIFPIGETMPAYSESNGKDKAVVNCLDSSYHKGWLDHGQRTMICEYDGGQAERIYNPCGDSRTIPTPSGGNHIPKIMLNRHFMRTGEYGDGIREEGEARFTLDSGSGHDLCVFTRTKSDQDYKLAKTEPSLRQSDKAETRIIQKTGIRRLTPTETERLQGFSDGWTKYGIDKNGNKIEISDTQRYKCCGNAVSTPVIAEVGYRLLRSLQCSE